MFATKAGNGSNGVTKCSFVNAPHFSIGVCCVLKLGDGGGIAPGRRHRGRALGGGVELGYCEKLPRGLYLLIVDVAV